MWKYIDKNQCNEFLLSLSLIDEKDKNKYLNKLYAISNNIENNYKIHKVKKRNGKIRTIYEPNATLKHIQRQILENILNNKEISNYATAYKSNLSIKDNAKKHQHQKQILKLDIKDFFQNITFLNIYNTCFPIYYFPKSIGYLLTYLTTYNNYLPQGSITAPYISNLVMKDFDIELGTFCDSKKINYTRYSDDMTFSGDFNPSEIINKVSKMLKSLGLELNYKKIHFIKNNKRQEVTGLVVNEKVRVKREYKKEIRKEMYYIKKYGLLNHLKKIGKSKDEKEYLNNLEGRILFVLNIEENNKEFLNYKNTIKKLKYNNNQK